MALQFFTIPVRYPDDATNALNGFLRQHHVLAIDRSLIVDGANSVWTVCVEFTPDESHLRVPLRGLSPAKAKSITEKC